MQSTGMVSGKRSTQQLERRCGASSILTGDSKTEAVEMTATPPWLTDKSLTSATRGRGRSTTLSPADHRRPKDGTVGIMPRYS